MSKFIAYVDKVLTANEQNPEPICPFPLNNGECYVDRRAPGEGCIDCEWAKKSYQALTVEDAQRIFADEIKEKADIIMQKMKEKRRGAKVFCVRCGSLGTRTPLRKWNDLYLCDSCYKIVKAEENNNEDKI